MSAMRSDDSNNKGWNDIYRLVRRIPRGKVVNYGQVAGYLSRPMSARAVGWAMHQCPDDVPWQRVVNAQGAVVTDELHPLTPGLQRKLLETEGVRFRANGTVDMDKYRWNPPGTSHRPVASKTRRK